MIKSVALYNTVIDSFYLCYESSTKKVLFCVGVPFKTSSTITGASHTCHVTPGRRLGLSERHEKRPDERVPISTL